MNGANIIVSNEYFDDTNHFGALLGSSNYSCKKLVFEPIAQILVKSVTLKQCHPSTFLNQESGSTKVAVLTRLLCLNKATFVKPGPLFLPPDTPSRPFLFSPDKMKLKLPP